MELWQRNLYILWAAVFLHLAAMSSIILFLPLLIEQEMGIKDEKDIALWSGLIFGINYFTAFLVSPIWGKLADKYGRKLMILRAGFGMTIIIILMGFATNVYQLFVLRLLNGLFAGFNSASITLISANTPKGKVGYALGTLQSGAVAGTVLGPLLGGLFADFTSYRNIFLYTGIIILTAFSLVLFLVKEDFTPNTTVAKRSMLDDFKNIINTQPLLTLFSVGFLTQFSLLNVMPILPLFIADLNPPGGKVAFFVGLVAASTGIANILSAPKLGKLGDKYGADKVLFYSLVLSAILFIPQGFSENVWWLTFWRFLLGFTLGGLVPSIDSLIRRFAPTGMIATTYAYNNSAYFLGGMLGPFFGGKMTGIIGFDGVFFFTAFLLFINSFWVYKILNKSINY